MYAIRSYYDLLSDYVYNLVVENGGMPVETPVMYDLQNNARITSYNVCYTKLLRVSKKQTKY